MSWKLADEWRPSKRQHYWERQEYCEDSRRLEETCCHSNSSERPSVNADVKNSKGVNNSNNNNNNNNNDDIDTILTLEREKIEKGNVKWTRISWKLDQSDTRKHEFKRSLLTFEILAFYIDKNVNYEHRWKICDYLSLNSRYL